MSLTTTPNVSNISKSGSALLSGAVTLSQGTNVTLTQSGQDISIASADSAVAVGGVVTGGTAGSVLFVATGPVLAQDNTNLFFDDANNRLLVPNIASGISSGGNLTLTSTTDPTKGKVILDDEISLWPSFPTAAAATGVLFSPSTIALNNYAAQLMDLSPTITFAGAVPIWSTIKSTVTCSIDTSTSFQFYSFQQAGTFTSTQKPIFFTFNLFLSNITFTTATAAKPPIAPIAFMCQNIIQVTANAAGTLGGDILSFSSSDTFQATAAGATATATNMTSFKSLPILKSSNATSAITVTNLRNFHAVVPTLTTTGALTITNSIGLDFENQSQTSGNLTVGTIAAVRSAQNVSSGGTAAWAILAIGTAASSFAGAIRIGDNTAPTAAVDISGAQANHIRMAGSTSAPASPTAGDIYYDTTQKTHKLVTTIGTEGNVGLINANTADSSAISNTSAETNFSLNFSCAANSLTVGKVIRIKGSGIYTSILTPTLQLKVKYGTVTLIDFGAISAGTAVTNRAFEIDMMFVVRTIGSTGTVMATGNIFMDNAASVVVTGTATCANNAGTTTIDTTAATNLQISATWSAASLTNTTTLENFIVEALG